MAGAESVIRAFIAFGETGDAVRHAQAAHRLAASGEYLVRIGLVPDVPHDAVVRRIEHIVQRYRQFHGQCGAEVDRQCVRGFRDLQRGQQRGHRHQRSAGNFGSPEDRYRGAVDDLQCSHDGRRLLYRQQIHF